MTAYDYFTSIKSLVDEDVIAFSAVDPKRGFIGEMVNTLRNQILGPISSIVRNFIDFDGQPYLLSTADSYIVIRVYGHHTYEVTKKTFFLRSEIEDLTATKGKGFPEVTFNHGGEKHSFVLLGAALLPGGSYYHDAATMSASQKMRDDMIQAVL